ncbi:MAG: hypothetical protein AAGH41_13550 [Pseudomonadota bacterium]
MRLSFSAAVAAFTLLGSAHAAIINLDSRDANNGVTLTLNAGTYKASFVDGQFSSWNAWGETVTSGCDSNGANCGRGWLTNTQVSSVELGTFLFGNNGRFATSAAAFAAAQPLVFTLTQTQQVVFRIADSRYNDNFGGISLDVREAAVPVPAAFALFACGAAGYTAFRRRR